MAGPLAGTAAAVEGRARLIPRSKIGLQLYSVRNLVSSLGFGSVFEELSRLGFRKVEFAGYSSGVNSGTTPAQIRQMLDDTGLEAVGSHISLNALRNDLDNQLDIAETLGMKHLGTASAPTNDRTIAGYTQAAHDFNSWGEVAIQRGIKIYQHNHTIEYSFAEDDPNVRLMDVFLAETDPNLVWLEMDICWAYGAARKYPRPGGEAGTFPRFEPVDYVNAAPERFPLFHVKDGVPREPASAGNSYFDVEFGAGVLPFDYFFGRLANRNRHIPLWEQDSAPGTPASEGAPSVRPSAASTTWRPCGAAAVRPTRRRGAAASASRSFAERLPSCTAERAAVPIRGGGSSAVGQPTLPAGMEAGERGETAGAHGGCGSPPATAKEPR